MNCETVAQNLIQYMLIAYSSNLARHNLVILKQPHLEPLASFQYQEE